VNWEVWLPTAIALFGSFLSGYFGVRIGMARMEERHIALTARVDKIEKRLDDMDDAGYKWRHDEYAPQISEIWLELRPLKAIVERIERLLQR